MLRCNNCGGNYRFDIKTQKIVCPYCENSVDPEEMDKFEAKTYDTYKYECPQCGGSINADDNEASVFCPYCGLSTMLEGKLSKASSPDYIIPFKKTKEECVSAYKKTVRKAIYAPRRFKKEGNSESFRGVYIPYWNYDVKQGDVDLEGVDPQIDLSNEKTVLQTYKMEIKMDTEYKGINFDASEAFDDELSNSIAPFNLEEKKAFAPGYVSGFYADNTDVASKTYQSRAKNMASDYTLKEVNKRKESKRFKAKISKEKNLHILNNASVIEKPGVGLMPVWFMSWKYGDRIAYACVNGQTGKASGKIPASSLKYLLFSLITAIPLFFILNIFTMPRPEVAVVMSNVLALIILLIYDTYLHRSVVKDEMGRINKDKYSSNVIIKPTKANKNIRNLLIIGLAICIPLYYVSIYFSMYYVAVFLWINVAIAILEIILTFTSIVKDIKKASQKRVAFIGIIVAAIVSSIVLWVDPISDVFFYLTSIVTLLLSGIAFLDLIHYHNMLTTIPMPQFAKKGGDDDAE